VTRAVHHNHSTCSFNILVRDIWQKTNYIVIEIVPSTPQVQDEEKTMKNVISLKEISQKITMPTTPAIIVIICLLIKDEE